MDTSRDSVKGEEVVAHSPPLPGEEGAGTAMAGCCVAFYGMQRVEKMLCRRQWAECVWQEIPSHPMLLTVSGEEGLAKDTTQLPVDCSPGRL